MRRNWFHCLLLAAIVVTMFPMALDLHGVVTANAMLFKEDFATYDPGKWVAATCLPWYTGVPQTISQTTVDGRSVIYMETNEVGDYHRRGIISTEAIPLASNQTTAVEMVFKPVGDLDGMAELWMIDPVTSKYAEINVYSGNWGANNAVEVWTDISGHLQQIQRGVSTWPQWFIFRIEANPTDTVFSLLDLNRNELCSSTYDVALYSLFQNFNLALGQELGTPGGGTWTMKSYIDYVEVTVSAPPNRHVQTVVSLVGDPVSTTPDGPFVPATIGKDGYTEDGGLPWYAHIDGASWIWMDDFVGDLDHPLYFPKTFTVPDDASNITATMEISADDLFVFSINGLNYCPDGPTCCWDSIHKYPVVNLVPGENHLLVTAWEHFPPSPSGLVYKLRVAWQSSPAVTTLDATNITINSARLNGELTSLGTASSVTVSFEWGTSPGSYPNETASETMTSAGTFYSYMAQPCPCTTYYYRAKAVGDGTVYDAEKSFTVLCTPPYVKTNDTTNVATTSATLNGDLISRGTASSVTVSFEWGTNSGSYSYETSGQVKASTGTFYFDLPGLTPSTTYYYRAKAVGYGTGYGAEKSFTTPEAVETIKMTILAFPFASVDKAFPVLVIVKNPNDSTIDDLQICIEGPQGLTLELPEQECIEPWWGIRANGYAFAIWFVSYPEEDDITIEVCAVGEIAGTIVSGCDTVEVSVYD